MNFLMMRAIWPLRMLWRSLTIATRHTHRMTRATMRMMIPASTSVRLPWEKSASPEADKKRKRVSATQTAKDKNAKGSAQHRETRSLFFNYMCGRCLYFMAPATASQSPRKPKPSSQVSKPERRNFEQNGIVVLTKFQMPAQQRPAMGQFLERLRALVNLLFVKSGAIATRNSQLFLVCGPGCSARRQERKKLGLCYQISCFHQLKLTSLFSYFLCLRDILQADGPVLVCDVFPFPANHILFIFAPRLQNRQILRTLVARSQLGDHLLVNLKRYGVCLSVFNLCFTSQPLKKARSCIGADCGSGLTRPLLSDWWNSQPPAARRQWCVEWEVVMHGCEWIDLRVNCLVVCLSVFNVCWSVASK